MFLKSQEEKLRTAVIEVFNGGVQSSGQIDALIARFKQLEEEGVPSGAIALNMPTVDLHIGGVKQSAVYAMQRLYYESTEWIDEEINKYIDNFDFKAYVRNEIKQGIDDYCKNKLKRQIASQIDSFARHSFGDYADMFWSNTDETLFNLSETISVLADGVMKNFDRKVLARIEAINGSKEIRGTEDE